ncbi:DinB family protein [Nocardioides ochotonae]|uniref:DinB family protein n=1 Tax=Nocardioides ochotonae TaxID=2685869 RepID=UPI0014090AF7|nr:DinB family protein [Nocardioides ochotonae]
MDEEQLRGATIRDVDLSGTRFVGVVAEHLEITGEFDRLEVNGVDVVPLVTAELDRRHPERTRLRPTTTAGYTEAFTLLEQLWAGTVDRARGLDPALLHERVDDEWSFAETLRHLVFATESWIGRVVQGVPSPWHPLSLPWEQMAPTPGVPSDRDARPGLEEVLELRSSRQAWVHDALDGLPDAALTEVRTVPDGPGWPPAGKQVPVAHALDIVINEEWWHRQYAERDLTALIHRQEQT